MKWFFRSIPILLFILQLIYTLNSQSQIRYEDLAESVRNVFWLEQGLVYDGVSTNVGWYGALLIIYKLFGFHLYGAQFFKLALYLVSMVCLGLLLRKHVKHFWLPWLVIGLSPTLLYYNTSQTSHGIDLLYFPIVLFLISHVRPGLVRLIGWALAMWAWMSYPSFVFYLPALAAAGWIRGIRGIVISLIAFLTPLVIGFLFVKNRSLLIFDSQTVSGIFRGAGGFDLRAENFSHNLGGLVKDLFIRGNSYHFEVNQAEFSLIFPILTVILISILSFKLREIRGRWGIGIIGGLVLVLILSSLTLDPSGAPGMRRYTSVLAAFYTLFILVWKQLVNLKSQMSNVKFLGVGLMSLLLVHHLVVYPINLIHIKDPSPNKEPLWFSRLENPQKSFDSLIETMQKEDLKLVCLDEAGKPFYCRISEVYAAVAGACLWNNLSCHQILGWDHIKGRTIPLSTELWDDYYFEH